MHAVPVLAGYVPGSPGDRGERGGQDHRHWTVEPRAGRALILAPWATAHVLDRGGGREPHWDDPRGQRWRRPGWCRCHSHCRWGASRGVRGARGVRCRDGLADFDRGGVDGGVLKHAFRVRQRRRLRTPGRHLHFVHGQPRAQLWRPHHHLGPGAYDVRDVLRGRSVRGDWVRGHLWLLPRCRGGLGDLRRQPQLLRDVLGRIRQGDVTDLLGWTRSLREQLVRVLAHARVVQLRGLPVRSESAPGRHRSVERQQDHLYQRSWMPDGERVLFAADLILLHQHPRQGHARRVLGAAHSQPLDERFG
mmetsp:Transcript_30318/g.72109  ORF Transcript_30318/g.72109 Transcript_30318/m.72109 type:complete len:305 (+) Transcript_30318:809-1723(+)